MSRTRIIFATGNAGKVREIRDIVGHMGIEVLTMREAGVETDPLEDGSSFEENALIKARSVAALVRKAEEEGRMEGPGQGVSNIVMSDDSGLVVDALGGAPGIYSARFQGRDTDYRVKMNYIMDQIRDVPWEGRTARFTAAVAAVLPDGRSFTVLGHMEGYIGYEIAGENGFGYDPFFYLPQYKKTSAEITPEEKNAISHRGRALRAMVARLQEEGVL
ncbi:MAG: RdgB/HAM1 family non-canonical purine NTP pyrophosphatase [Lachnospiraceae bacterium]|nr:RdgB/HAM1 family non-canonical purine NTP pyrophosphatase [Lachnospiraceae bacterium]